MRHLTSWDSVTGLLLAGLGAALVLGSRGFPAAAGGVPGPGFFPMATGALLLVLGGALTLQGARHAADYWEKGWRDPAVARIIAVLGMIAIYIALWEVVPFLWRTPVSLAAVYIVLGERWPRALAFSAMITAALYGVFEGLLEVRL